MAFQIQFANLVLDGFEEWGEQNDSRIQEHRIPRRQGSLAPQVPAVDSRQISLRGELWGISEADLKSKLKTLRNTLAYGRGRLIEYDDGAFLNVIKANFRNTFRAARMPSECVGVSLDFLADDPYWYSATDKSPVNALTGVIDTFSVTNEDLAPTPPVFEITRQAGGADWADVTLTQTTTSLFLKFAGLLAIDQTLIFDCVNRRVMLSGADVLHAFVPGSIDMELVPGVNNFEYKGPANVSILTHFRERWL